MGFANIGIATVIGCPSAFLSGSNVDTMLRVSDVANRKRPCDQLPTPTIKRPRINGKRNDFIF